MRCVSGPSQQGRQASFGPCLDFGFQYALKRNNPSKNFGVEYWTIAWLKFSVAALRLTRMSDTQYASTHFLPNFGPNQGSFKTSVN
jgi:hypothetical protein